MIYLIAAAVSTVGMCVVCLCLLPLIFNCRHLPHPAAISLLCMAILAVYAYLLTVFLMNGNWISLAPAQMLAILGLMTYGAPVGSFLNGKTPVVVS